MKKIISLLVLFLFFAQSFLTAETIKINFQREFDEVPAGYEVDYGQPFGDRGNDLTYGWDQTVDETRDRNSANAPDQRYDTLNHMQKTEGRYWEISVENGKYNVHIVCGDPSNTDQINSLMIESIQIDDPDGEDNFDEYSTQVDVADGRLTIEPGIGSDNAKLCFVDIETVVLTNTPPDVNTGGDKAITWPVNQVLLDGSVEDDGMGLPDGYLFIRWSKVSGPGAVSFIPDENHAQTIAVFSETGIYTLKLYATDGEFNTEKTITVSVNEPECPLADLTFDCKVEMDDLVIFAGLWLTDLDVDADITLDDEVNLEDLAAMSQDWLADWTGTLTVSITPLEAVNAGAQWRMDSGTWMDPGQSIVSVPGSHILEYKVVDGYVTPSVKQIYIGKNQDFTAEAIYYEASDLPLEISEFMAMNSNLEDLRPALSESWSTLVHGIVENPDWIEIHNTGDSVIQLEGWYLTDDPDNLMKWQFPEGYSIDSDGYLVVYASNKEYLDYPNNYPFVDDSGNLHTNFELDGDGEYLAIVAADGTSVVFEYNDYPSQRGLVTYGVGASGGVGYLKGITRGDSNTEIYDDVVADTVFSIDRGFYDQPIEVDITSATTDAVIRYTTDGSAPSETHGEYYLGTPIAIDTTTCLRAIAYKSDWLSTNIDTHTYIYLDDVIYQANDPGTGAQVVPDGYPAQWISYQNNRTINGDYQMDPDVVGPYSSTIKDDLKSVPTISVVTDKENLFGDYTGIYTNQSQDGTERRCSMELIDPAGVLDDLQIDCSVRMQGGASSSASGGTSLNRWKIPKLSMRLKFKGAYGASKLRYKLFEEEDAADWFDTIVLDARSNNVWYHSDGGQRNRAQYTRDQLCADMQNALGGYGPYGRPVHVYLNGLYWGMYWIHERPDHSFVSAYLGNEPEDYDVMKHSYTSDYIVNGSNGDYIDTMAVPTSNFELFQQKMDVPNLIDYLIVNYYLGNWDWSHKNWYLSRNRRDPQGKWRFHCWDGEHIIEAVNEDRTPQKGGTGSPEWLNYTWMNNSQYKMMFGDRVHKHFYNGGEFTPEKVIEHYMHLVNLIDRAIVGESARWGDFRRETPYTRDVEWWNQRQWILNEYLPGRRDEMIRQFRNRGWYPQLDATTYSQHGGYVDPGFELTVTNPNGYGEVYYTLDGTDPSISGILMTGSTGGGGDDPMERTLVPESAPKKVFVPTSDIGTDWRTDIDYIDNSWTYGTPPDDSKSGGVGFDSGSTPDFLPHISYNIQSQMSGHWCAYVRIKFNVDQADLDQFNYMTVKVRADDAAVVYLNGYSDPIYSYNFTGVPVWDTDCATGDDSPDFKSLNITSHLNKLHAGENFIAIHGMNTSLTSSDFLVSCELIAGYTPGAADMDYIVTFDKSELIKTRVKNGSDWSALNEVPFSIGPIAESLRVTEIMYNPADPNHEFIELQNVGGESINLNLVKFTRGIDYTFGDYDLGSGQFVLLVRNQAAFEQKYGTGLPVAGQYTGALNNGGDKIKVKDAVGGKVQTFDYNDWYALTDGLGFSLTIIDAYSTDPNDWDDKDGWRASTYKGGSPGAADIGPSPDSIVINEILAHSHDPDPMNPTPDWIELKNTTNQDIDISGWFLSDEKDNDDPTLMMKYEFPQNTTIKKNDFLVIYEDETFGNQANANSHIQFGLSEGGETLYLRSGDAGQLTGEYQTEQDFDASDRSVTLGRYEKSSLSNGYDFIRMDYPTPGDDNSGPKISDVVISKIMYAPANDGGEYIEIYNRSGSPVTLMRQVTDETSPGVFESNDVPWHIGNAIDYLFPVDTTISAGDYRIIAKNPDGFKAQYPSVPASKVLGPFDDGKLNNGGEKVELRMPGDQEYGKNRYKIPVDEVNYESVAPWPTSPLGGDRLQRIDVDAYANDYENWTSGDPDPTN